MITTRRPDELEAEYVCYCGRRHDWRDGALDCSTSVAEELRRTIAALQARVAKLEKLEQNRWNWQRARERVEEKFR